MDFVAGMTWGWPGRRGTWTTPEAERSMQLMKDRLGVTWTTLAFAALQDNAQSTEIHWRDAPTVDEAEVRAGIEAAHALGLKVCLKPMVNCADGTWRAHINFFDVDVPGEPTWAEWFASYTEYLVHYARVAQQTGCELFCIGCEMVQSDRRESEWRALIAEVRAVYSGAVTYNCDKYQEDRLTWWDAVDVISSSGYYPEGSWPAQLDRIEQVVTAHGKPFVFLEGGCPSREGSAACPNDWTHVGAPSQADQSTYYREAFAATASRPWVRGFTFWDWPARLYPEDTVATNTAYCVFGKPAEALIKEHYTART